MRVALFAPDGCGQSRARHWQGKQRRYCRHHAMRPVTRILRTGTDGPAFFTPTEGNVASSQRHRIFSIIALPTVGGVLGGICAWLRAWHRAA